MLAAHLPLIAAGLLIGEARVAIVVTVARPEAEQTPTDTWVFDVIAATLRFFPELEAVTAAEMTSSEGGRRIDDEIRACRADLRCIAARLENAGVELGLALTINTERTPLLITGELVEAQSKRKAGDLFAEVPDPARLEEALQAEAERAFVSLGFARGGRLAVSVSPGEARIEILGGRSRPDPVVPSSFTLLPGDHQVRVSHPGFESELRTVSVRAGEITGLELHLREERSVWASPWLWIAVGTVAAAGGITAGVLLSRPHGDPTVLYDPN